MLLPKSPVLEFQAVQGKIGVLLLYVKDFPRMLKFYRDILGLPLSKIHPGKEYEPLIDWAQFEPDGDTAVELLAETCHGPANTLPLPRINALIVAFQVGDIDAVYAKLKANGLEFPKGIGEEDWGRYVHFKDPEGNRLQLYEPRPGFKTLNCAYLVSQFIIEDTSHDNLAL